MANPPTDEELRERLWSAILKLDRLSSDPTGLSEIEAAISALLRATEEKARVNAAETCLRMAGQYRALEEQFSDSWYGYTSRVAKDALTEAADRIRDGKG